MPAFHGPITSEATPAQPKQPPPLTPEVIEPTTRQPARQPRSRSTTREAHERLAAKADAMAEAVLRLAGLGDNPEDAAKDESVRARLLTDGLDRVGVRAPQVSAVVHVHADLESALVDLERMLGGRVGELGEGGE